MLGRCWRPLISCLPLCSSLGARAIAQNAVMGREVPDVVLAQIAASLAARHIGGAVNYVAVAEATGMSASAQAAGLAADNLVSCARH